MECLRVTLPFTETFEGTTYSTASTLSVIALPIAAVMCWPHKPELAWVGNGSIVLVSGHGSRRRVLSVKYSQGDRQYSAQLLYTTCDTTESLGARIVVHCNRHRHRWTATDIGGPEGVSALGFSLCCHKLGLCVKSIALLVREEVEAVTWSFDIEQPFSYSFEEARRCKV